MLSKRTTWFVFVLLAALIACNLSSSAATIMPTTIPAPTASNSTEVLTQTPEQEETQAPGDQDDAPPPTDLQSTTAAGIEPTVPGATTAPTLPPTATAPPLSDGVVDHVIVYGRDPIYKGGTAHIGWEAPGAYSVSIAAYGVDDYQSGSLIRDYDPARLADLTPIKVYWPMPATGSLQIYIPPDFAHQHMILAVLPDGYDVTTISSSALAVIYPNEPGPDSPIYDFSGDLAIREFWIDPPDVERGGQISLRWEVAGATKISITRLSERGGIYLESIAGNLDPVGYLSYSIPEDYINEISFLLIATDEAGNQMNETATITIACPFETVLNSSCPISQAIVEAAYQPFEHGFMVWMSGDPATIFVMYEDTTWQKYEDTWVDGETLDVGESPPDGLYQPAHGFGKVWAAEAEVRDKLGWAIEPEVGYTADMETHKCYFSHYVTGCVHIELPDGRVLSLETGWRVE